MKRDPRGTAVYQDCLKLFVEYGGKEVVEIEREMRGRLGHTNFHRRILYGRSKGGNYSPGWIEEYGWKTLIPNASPSLLSPTGTKIIAQGKAAGRHPGYMVPDRPLPEGEQQQPSSSPRLSVQTKKMRIREWLERVSPGMKWDWPHLRIVQEYLELVTKGEVKRLMIFMPPRHGKSELVTVRYAAKRLADDPTMNVIIGSYNQRLANRFSRKVRRVLADANALSVPPASADGPVLSVPSASADGPVLSVPSASADASVLSEPPAVAGGFTAETQSHGETTGGDATVRERAETTGSTGGNTVRGERPPSQTTTPQSAFRIPHSAEEWETPHGGGVRAVGVGAGVTGYGASLIIIDDPVKNRAEAESKTYRDKVYDWFNDDISTRLEPDGAIILIQTRWHEDDLAGRLIREMADGGEYWDILALPAIAEGDITAETPALSEPRTVVTGFSPTAETQSRGDIKSSPPYEGGVAAVSADGVVLSPDSPSLCLSSVPAYFDPLGRLPGEALCPERFPIEDLEKMRRRLGSYSFSALYQQRPTPLEGGLFKRAWFMNNVIEKLPVGVKLVRAYDLAVSTRTTADYTASVLGGFDNRGNFYIADIMRRRLEFPEQKRFILDRMMREPHIQHGVELALHGQAIIQDLRRFAPTRAVALKGIRVATDKITRALAWAALAEERKLFLVRGPYLRDFIDEAASFPNSKHDDQIDAVSLAISMSSQHKRFRHAGF